MALIFEHGDWIDLADRSSLEDALVDLWERTRPPEDEDADETSSRRYQPFLQFDGKRCRARNFAGFIQNGDDSIEIYPKVFRRMPDSAARPDLMLKHILYWFSYCRRWRFPVSNALLDDLVVDNFPELIINLIATRFHGAVSATPYHAYHPMEETLETPRGSINFGRYATSSLATGAFHRLECDHEPFVYDNTVNRIIKYCARLLMGTTRFAENLRMLEEITFILCDVEDRPYVSSDLQTVSVSPFFEEYIEVLDLCRIVLSRQLYSSRNYELQHWCLLFPMEYIFEDFIAGFLETHFGAEWKVEYQKSNTFLSDAPRAFMMQQDFVLTSRSPGRRTIVIDTKYKLRDPKFKSDIKKGVSQGDMYQMLAYATKLGCREVILLYPNSSEQIKEPDTFEITSGFDSREVIHVTAAEVPFWSASGHRVIDDRLRAALSELLSD